MKVERYVLHVEELFIDSLVKWEPRPLLCAGEAWNTRLHWDGAKSNRASLLPSYLSQQLK